MASPPFPFHWLVGYSSTYPESSWFWDSYDWMTGGVEGGRPWPDILEWLGMLGGVPWYTGGGGGGNVPVYSVTTYTSPPTEETVPEGGGGTVDIGFVPVYSVTTYTSPPTEETAPVEPTPVYTVTTYTSPPTVDIGFHSGVYCYCLHIPAHRGADSRLHVTVGACGDS